MRIWKATYLQRETSESIKEWQNRMIYQVIILIECDLAS